MNFIYTIDPSAEVPIMLVDKHIGYDEEAGHGIMGDQFARELLTLDSIGKRNVHVWFASVGGSVIEGEKIYSAILNSKAKVDTYAMGVVASIAAVAFQAGRKRIMADYATLMYHNPYGGPADQIKVLRDSISTMICERAGRKKDEVLNMMNRTTWINAAEAKEGGFCDEILATSEANRGRLSRVSNDAKEYWKESVLVMNSLLNESNQLKPFHNEQNMSLSKVYNKLDLVEGAKEEAVLAAIEKIENRAKEAAAEVADLKNKLQTAGAEKAKVEAELAEAKNKLSAAETEKEAAQKVALKTKAEALVKEHEGKIKADTKNSWIEKASKSEESFNDVKEMLEAIPLNKEGKNLVKEVKNSEGVQIYSMAAKMAEINNKAKL